MRLLVLFRGEVGLWHRRLSDHGECENTTPNVGLEPTPLRLRVSCSTDGASRAFAACRDAVSSRQSDARDKRPTSCLPVGRTLNPCASPQLCAVSVAQLLGRSAVNRKDGGSSPPRDEIVLFCEKFSSQQRVSECCPNAHQEHSSSSSGLNV